jgi:putative transferase (TIGR04331 family)
MRAPSKQVLVCRPGGEKMLTAPYRPLFAGLWCLSEPLSCEGSVLEYPWSDRKKLRLEYDEVQTLFHEIISAFTPILNNIHSLDLNKRDWMGMLGYWLQNVGAGFIDRYKVIEGACKAEVELILMSDLNLEEWSFFELNRASQAISTFDHYNDSIFNFIGKHFFNMKEVGYRSEHVHTEYDLLRNPLEFLNKVHRIWFANAPVRYDIPATKIFKIKSILSGALPQKMANLPMAKPSSRDESLRSLLRWSEKSHIEQAFSEFIRSQLPTCFLEDFEHVRMVVKSRYRTKPRLIITNNAFANNPPFSLWVANCRNQYNTKLAIAQHGGNYGIAEWSATEDHERFISDYYVTWGWVERECGKDDAAKCVALPSAYLSALPKVMPKKDGSLLIQLMELPRYAYWMHAMPTGPEFKRYVEHLEGFLKSLPEHVKSQVSIRPYPTTYGWNIEKYLKNRISDDLHFINPANSTTFEDLQDSKIFVATYNATGLLETLSINFPTIIYWNPQHFELRPKARPFFEGLAKVGIFHTSLESVRAHLAMNWDSPSKWWLDVETQSAVRRFCEFYANRSSNSVPAWRKFFASHTSMP